MMHHLDQGQSIQPDKQTSLEDRYYNNQSFQEEYPVNDPEVRSAATKIQANFRGHKARQNVEKMKHDNKQILDTDQQELGYDRNQSATPNEDNTQEFLPSTSTRVETQQSTDKTELEKYVEEEPVNEGEQLFNVELTEEEREEQERAARSIQARFRGFQAKKSGNREQVSPGNASEPEQISDRRQQQESDNEKTPTPTSTRLSGKTDRDRHDLGGNLTANDQNETGENDDTDRPRLEREPTQLSADFERHTQVPHDSDFDREERPDLNNEEDDDDMNDPNLEKAATRIQASYRGYKTRKELGSGDTQDQNQPPTSTSPRTHDEYDNTHNKMFSPSGEGQKEPEGEDDDNAAAVKIQAAYRGYKVRKDLEK